MKIQTNISMVLPWTKSSTPPCHEIFALYFTSSGSSLGADLTVASSFASAIYHQQNNNGRKDK